MDTIEEKFKSKEKLSGSLIISISDGTSIFDSSFPTKYYFRYILTFEDKSGKSESGYTKVYEGTDGELGHLKSLVEGIRGAISLCDLRKGMNDKILIKLAHMPSFSYFSRYSKKERYSRLKVRERLIKLEKQLQAMEKEYRDFFQPW